MSEQLYQLAYVSSALNWMEQDELEALLAKARSNNHRLGVSGMLLYADGAFIQVLEGDRQRVVALYNVILRDPRHTRQMVIHEGPLTHRHFPDWKMGFRYLDRNSFCRLPGFSDLMREGSPAGEAFRSSPHASYKLLLSFSECSAVVPSIAV